MKRKTVIIHIVFCLTLFTFLPAFLSAAEFTELKNNSVQKPHRLIGKTIKFKEIRELNCRPPVTCLSLESTVRYSTIRGIEEDQEGEKIDRVSIEPISDIEYIYYYEGGKRYIYLINIWRYEPAGWITNKDTYVRIWIER